MSTLLSEDSPHQVDNWPAVWAVLETEFRAGETFPHDPANSQGWILSKPPIMRRGTTAWH